MKEPLVISNSLLSLIFFFRGLALLLNGLLAYSEEGFELLLSLNCYSLSLSIFFCVSLILKDS